MTAPVTASRSKEALDCHVDEQATSTTAVATPEPQPAESLACTAEPAQSSVATAGTQGLVARFPPPPIPKPAPSGSPPIFTYSTLTSSTSAAPSGSSLRASALSAEAAVGPLKTTLEVGAAHFQSGTDADAQVAAVRRTSVLSGHGFALSVMGDIAAARVNLGENNDDGSIGGNIGASVEGIGFEATLDTPVGSLTYGQGASLGASGSLGVRDADHDGDPEYCAKFAVPAFTVGACVEQFW